MPPPSPLPVSYISKRFYSSTVVASLEAARDAKAPIILQMSQGGAAYFCGKGVKNDKQQASIAGAVAAAHFIRSIAPSYEIPVVLHTGTRYLQCVIPTTWI